MASLLSVNGKLRSLFFQAGAEEERSTGYKALDIGEPLIVRYLYFLLRFETKEDENELMISTFGKTTEEKEGAAEAINYFNPKTNFTNGQFRLSDFGAQYYGHELCYYTKSYLGESIRLTTKITELDKVDDELVKAIKTGVETIAGLPFFVEFLPYAALASTSLSIFEKLANIFNPDDVIVHGDDLDLHFNRNNARRLQSGRIVCVPKRDDGNFLAGDKYKLTTDNRLVDSDGHEYTESSYYVLQINNEKNSLYEKFDYFQNAAALLQKTNRGGDPREFVDGVVTLLQGSNDMYAVKQIEELAFDVNDEEGRKKVKALYKLMTSDMKRLYKSRVDDILVQGS